MFRLAFALCLLITGFVLGVRYDRDEMRKECAAGEGQWTGTICVNSELLQ